MGASLSKKQRVDSDLNHDYISNLPLELKKKILVQLPIKEMVKTSILSSKWIDLWTLVPDLVFEEKCTESKLIEMVDTVLITHQGPIQKFKLVSDHACNEAISRWLLILSKKGIKDLHLVFDDQNRCKIPFRLISCIVLEHLYLSGCSIMVPPYFQGFKLVRTIILSNFDLSWISIENMVSGCPLLDHLGLSYFTEQGCLSILAPNLTSLSIFGDFHDICLETPKLASGIIYLVTAARDYQKFSVARDRKESNIIRALGRLSNIQKLDICGEFCDYLAIGPIPENLPAIFNQLTEMCVHIYIFPNGITTALCLFENAPNLEVLHVEFWAYEGVDQPNVEALSETEANQDRLFKCLKVVNITYVPIWELSLRSTKSVLEFAKLVLSTAPLLDNLNFMELEDAMVIFEMLKWFPKLSMDAEIVIVPKSEEG